MGVNNCSEVLRHKINIEKSIVFLYTNDGSIRKKKKENHPIHNSIKNNKILRNKFTQDNETYMQ